MSRTVVVAHPSADVYGADLQLVQTVAGTTARGWRVVVAVPGEGPLLPLLRDAGAQVVTLDVPVLRKAYVSPGGIARLAGEAARVTPSLVRLLRREAADVLLVNTVTIPWWLTAARLARVPSVCHVHEAESSDSALMGRALNAPLLTAGRLIFNSAASRDASLSAVPALGGRAELVYNGVPEPDRPMPPPRLGETPVRLAVISRWSPRKRVHDAVAATALLREQGTDVRLGLNGSVFDGYEWYEQELRDQVAAAGLQDVVTFHGYRPMWEAFAEADVFLAPSSREPFGNTLVEAQLAGRPVVAAAAGGHLEILQDGVTGRLVTPEDPAALAGAVTELVADPDGAMELARAGTRAARERFSVASYGRRMTEELERAAARR